MPTLAELNQLKPETCEKLFFACCSSLEWAKKFTAKRPFKSESEMLDESEKLWFSLGPTDWLEAFSHHPRIGQKTALNKWTSQEQAGVGAAQEATLKNLIKFNEEYEAKFDHVFLICATGKPAAEMLKALQERIQNSPEQELKNACVEQSKITKIRLQKLLGEP